MDVGKRGVKPANSFIIVRGASTYADTGQTEVSVGTIGSATIVIHPQPVEALVGKV